MINRQWVVYETGQHFRGGRHNWRRLKSFASEFAAVSYAAYWERVVANSGGKAFTHVEQQSGFPDVKA
jgi:hypothetical protein